MRLRDRRETRDLIPASMPQSAGRYIVAHIGAQTIRVPTAILINQAREQLQRLEDWKERATGTQLVMYGTLKAALNMAIPVFRELTKGSEQAGIPPLPKRERHSDPVVYLLAYLNSFLPYILSKGEFTVDVDDNGEMTALDWSYLDELDAARALEVVDAAPPELEREV